MHVRADVGVGGDTSSRDVFARVHVRANVGVGGVGVGVGADV